MKQKSFIVLVIVFVLPLILGTIYFQYVSKYGNQSTSNYGELISPMQQIQELPPSVQKFWTYAVVSLSHCDTTCQHLLKQAGNTRLLTNEEMTRVRTLFIGLTPLIQKDKPNNFVSQINELTHKQHYQTLVTKIKQSISNNSETAIHKNIYLFDPLGNLMMMYPPNKQDPKKMLGDIKRLLKYSRIG